MSILVTGGNGQVGFELRRQFALFGSVLAPTRQELDLADIHAVEAYLAKHKPALILNAAAYTAVDKAECEPEQAKRLNADLPAQLARYAAQNGITLVHYSSDYVYPGKGVEPWREDSPTNPLSTYGQTKLEGDEAILRSGCDHLIFRTSWVYAARGNNFMKTMLRLGREREALSIVNDQIGAPTPARLIAQISALAFTPHDSPSTMHHSRFTPHDSPSTMHHSRFTPHDSPSTMHHSRFTPHDSPSTIHHSRFTPHIPLGVYHLAPRGNTSWHGFACEIFHQAKALGKTLAIDASGLKAIPTAAYPTQAVRPSNSRMALDKLEAVIGLHMPEWQDQLALTLQEYCER
ncbi:SDR family oxidoreductase [Halomonas dongshanensis]|uniref:dTDP-4-dehydrorhamnose reductase n=1 Tax=Halomonas dongshanensis TaxID=2890835 RepID=A0ABT2ECP8_9GAMM|nr:dTDP-4-dehydrorhamnose reductase [Halomonas dongshanensis]MCS2609138.1 NAD(P)-dependent oxidoreductase [Halomonas dongshanensis]